MRIIASTLENRTDAARVIVNDDNGNLIDWFDVRATAPYSGFRLAAQVRTIVARRLGACPRLRTVPFTGDAVMVDSNA